jgi:dolichyl-phosphate beta-glucosyltransferase
VSGDVVIVVPCYNEAKRLNVAAFAAHADVQFLFVDDGSTDDTRTMLQQAATQHAHFRVHVQPKNGGKGEAVRCGLLAALAQGARMVCYLDADLATSIAEMKHIAQVLHDRTDVDVAMGSRIRMLGRAIDRTPMRHYLGRLFATCASLTLRLPVYDTQCGAKAFRDVPALRTALATPMTTRWTFDVELLMRLQQAGVAASQMAEWPLQAWAEKGGGTLGPSAMIKAAFDLFGLWWRSRR